MWVAFAHFCSKNINVFENTLATTLNEFISNELVKLRMLWTTGPRNAAVVFDEKRELEVTARPPSLEKKMFSNAFLENINAKVGLISWLR